jgi:catechol 2,3-dioxygenase-like lactoylglutathione lyase family enzyme
MNSRFIPQMRKMTWLLVIFSLGRSTESGDWSPLRLDRDDRPPCRRCLRDRALCPDPVETARFYEEILNLRPLEEPDELSAAFRLPDGRMLLIFDAERASRPGRRVPSHGAQGPGHVAFSVVPGALNAFLAALRQRGVEVEREIGWGAGGRSVYFRDPAGNSVELVEGEAWPDAGPG